MNWDQFVFGTIIVGGVVVLITVVLLGVLYNTNDVAEPVTLRNPTPAFPQPDMTRDNQPPPPHAPTAAEKAAMLEGRGKRETRVLELLRRTRQG